MLQGMVMGAGSLIETGPQPMVGPIWIGPAKTAMKISASMIAPPMAPRGFVRQKRQTERPQVRTLGGSTLRLSEGARTTVALAAIRFPLLHERVRSDRPSDPPQ